MRKPPSDVLSFYHVDEIPTHHSHEIKHQTFLNDVNKVQNNVAIIPKVEDVNNTDEIIYRMTQCWDLMADAAFAEAEQSHVS